MDKLEHCPFCGGDGKLIGETIVPNGEFFYRIKCVCCGAGIVWRYTPDGATEAWNTRTKIESSIYDQEEVIEGCTVQILTNTETGDVSVGWWKSNE